ncbi:hypothetical protein IFM58399_01979 [Aspergillus lentulus]|uniref:BZIP domain-containing protein n=1 Tax=Aspergillus lentulus TaxID=293939 RepID=A0ABQ0ZXA9_ASPLE|nr:uncharacterized protein IFM58399_01979 [Aspergillus lentulus]GFF28445.1 hypothetical protein IFM58399_01979 [Aspergillus lentulus]GFF49192.1 hypothetical protein IFM62136_01210 [Aspergillus lentulus]GFF67599.1 hypothetical protein IFM60648_02320 [Aspergillus lentulus]GFG05561.1 hypothetical protein IFM61392_03898 [Aspergillus lentulus]
MSEQGFPLLTWEEVHQNLVLSSRSRSAVPDLLGANKIASLLSASSYLLPERSISPETATPHPRTQLYGGFYLEDPPGGDQQPEASKHKSSKRTRTDIDPTDGSLSRKRGRPRKSAGEGEDPHERRRMQIRLAQRAYRSRKEASVSSLQSRVLKLESAVEQISAAFLSFSDELIQSEVLASDPRLTLRLRDTVQLCLSLAKGANMTGDQNIATTVSSPSEESHSSSEEMGPQRRQTSLATSPPYRESTESEDSGTLQATGFMGTAEDKYPHEAPSLDLSAFIERLHFACLYEGYSALSDTAVGMDILQRPFRFLLRLMDRKRVTSYFEACLHAKASRKRLDEWKEIPYFKIGGAGTHYPRKTKASSNETLPRWENIQDPTSELPQEVQHELDGEWFDIQDLEGFLLEKEVAFVVGDTSNSSDKRNVVNAARLIQELLKTGICLGRTPGFRRKDVEEAIHVAMCS